ncbi:hypothetical protein NDN16_10515 [Aureimonas altamirensis]|uniref:hypothetical protein n=1 Tax=Aureimonas altamirensis TaxID=370622 RepID=UPI002036EFC2|nr:hypothetical protein [Aureimonas altamirensis]MCM2504104.1 hypothetical protein [Aureimonas altamirensis]
MTTIEFPELPDQQYESIVSLLLKTAHALNRRSMLDAADVRGFLAEMSIFPISSSEVCEALTPAPADIGKSLTPTPKHTLSNALYRLV